MFETNKRADSVPPGISDQSNYYDEYDGINFYPQGLQYVWFQTQAFHSMRLIEAFPTQIGASGGS